MTTITLPPDIGEVIEKKAKQRGTTAELLIINELRARHLPPVSPAPPVEGETMADFFKDFIGCIDSSHTMPDGSNASENTGRRFREIMLRKHRAGKL